MQINAKSSYDAGLVARESGPHQNILLSLLVQFLFSHAGKLLYLRIDWLQQHDADARFVHAKDCCCDSETRAVGVEICRPSVQQWGRQQFLRLCELFEQGVSSRWASGKPHEIDPGEVGVCSIGEHQHAIASQSLEYITITITIADIALQCGARRV
jgi:hypothetical protein